MNDLTLTRNYDIRSYETDEHWRATLPALCNHLQDIATRHAADLGFGYEDLIRTRRIWVLSRAYLHMDAMPGFGESVAVQTWPSGTLKTVATRDFVVRQNEHVIGRGVSAWAVIDLDTRKATSVDDLLEQRVIPDLPPALEFEGRAVKRIKEGEREVRIIARKGDHDVNGHVNSIRQVEFLLESAPEQWQRERRCVGGDVQYRAECHAGDELRCLCMPQDDDTALHILMRTSDDREVARMKTWWK
ncbi:acyl-[acyl-carrier-protein] thioesterase [Salidesulfovibrio onnuriiensis]|uniref:acyl-[acyl-carrier-protein] thioesterase n=1 Tax=Salidesulfovibrio onnuriiensis TaxID=2583823 RepID=UPI0011C9B3AB|nr:acyl-ACP thioesterase domain-containing protein [Salidesulfovibrio onnuriiensis]